MSRVLTPGMIQRLLRTNAQEILRQLGSEETRIGVSMRDSEAYLHVSVRPERVSAMPKSVRVSSEEGPVDIPLNVTGDYEPLELHSR